LKFAGNFITRTAITGYDRAMTTFEPWNAERAEALIEQNAGRQGPLLPILHAIEEAFGHVPAAAVALIAERLNLSRAEVHGAVTFYHDFHAAPRSGRTVKICRGEACQAMGGTAMARAVCEALGVGAGEAFGGTSRDGATTVEEVFCLGLCGVAPAAMVEGRPLGRMCATDLLAAIGS